MLIFTQVSYFLTRMLHWVVSNNAGFLNNKKSKTLSEYPDVISPEEIKEILSGLLERKTVKVMIHEQYFYKDYERYIPDFEDRIEAAFRILIENGYKSIFFENML